MNEFERLVYLNYATWLLLHGWRSNMMHEQCGHIIYIYIYISSTNVYKAHPPLKFTMRNVLQRTRYGCDAITFDPSDLQYMTLGTNILH